MSYMPGIPWMKVALNFIWILGFAILLVSFSLVSLKKKSGSSGYRWTKSDLFARPFILGVILVLVGAASSLVLRAVSAPPHIISIQDRVSIPLEGFMGNVIVKNEELIFGENGLIRSDKIQFDKAQYKIRIFSYGNAVLDETARFRVYVGMYHIGDYNVPTKYRDKTFNFNCHRAERWRLRIEYVNDIWYPPKNLNRNGYIGKVSIEKVSDDPGSDG